MDKKVVRYTHTHTYTYTMEYYAAIKRSKSESVLVDEPKACYTEWSKSEKEKQILYINAYIWNLEQLY